MLENTEDLILLLGAITALFSGACAAIRMSRCDLIKCCGMEIHRVVKGGSPTPTEASVQV
jgi:hypothetical protein